MWGSMMSTYLPSEDYRNYDMSNLSVLHMWAVCYFSTQPLTFPLFIVNQPKIVKPQQYRLLLLPLFLRSPYQFLLLSLKETKHHKLQMSSSWNCLNSQVQELNFAVRKIL